MTATGIAAAAASRIGSALSWITANIRFWRIVAQYKVVNCSAVHYMLMLPEVSPGGCGDHLRGTGTGAQVLVNEQQ